MQQPKNKLYSGLVWLFSGCMLLAYGVLGLSNTNVPGVEELVSLIHSAQGGWLYAAAFLSIFIEGLYVIGSFFPGSTLVILIAIAAQVGGIPQFAGVILAMYIGWLLAGVVNVFGAKYFKQVVHIDPRSRTALVDNVGITWFPAFRANTEVGQVAEGHSPLEVLLSTFRVKTYATLGAVVYTFLIPLFLDIESRTNEEGFLSLGIIALISFAVGGHKLYQYQKERE